MSKQIKSTVDIFKETLVDLGFAGYKPSEMSNSDYWMCTCTAMEKYHAQFEEEKFSHKEMIEFSWWLIDNLGAYSDDKHAHFEGKYVDIWQDFKKLFPHI